MAKSICCYCEKEFIRRYPMVINNKKKYHARCLESVKRVRDYRKKPRPNSEYQYDAWLEFILVNLTHLENEFNE